METKEMHRAIRGVVPIVPIPFGGDDEIDESALRRLIEFAVSTGVGAVCLPAYASEFYKLSGAERMRVVEIAAEQARGRLTVIGQCNHGASRIAREFARANVARGAGMISIALPRQFPLSEADLLRYTVPVLESVDVPCLVQDFNPGGPAVGVEFIVRLKERCPNFCYLKLEEPMLAPKVVAIREATGGEVGVLEGWGGLYMMELIPAGICGIMPGLALADVLNRVFELRAGGQNDAAFRLFEQVLPQIFFSLQNMELFLYCEKRLLQARGVLGNSRARSASLTPDALTAGYVGELNERILRLLSEGEFRTAPAAAI